VYAVPALNGNGAGTANKNMPSLNRALKLSTFNFQLLFKP